MLSYRQNILLHIFLLVIFGIEIFSSLLFITDDSELINIDKFVRSFCIINFIFNICFFGYLIVKIYTLLERNCDYDYEYIDYWFFVLMTTAYFIFFVFFYSIKFDLDTRNQLMDNYNFRIFLYSLLPIAIIYITVTGLILFSLILVLIYYCCFKINTNNRIMPT